MTLRLALIDIRVQHGYAVPPGVLFQRFQVIKAHRLLVEDGHEKLQRIIILEPGRLVGGHAEGEGVRLREHVLAVELFEDLVGGFRVDAPGCRAVEKLLP